MPLKPCERSLRNAVVPQRTPGCDTTFTICAWSLRAVNRSESAPVSVTTAVICLLSSGGWPNSLVMQDQMDVSTLSRRVISPGGSTLIHSITEWPSLLPSSHARTPVGLPYGSLSLAGDVRDCLVFCDDVYRAFTWVRHTIHPSPISVSVLTDTSAPRGCDASLATVGSLSEGSVRVVTFPHIFVEYC